jgi:hypothetical protein
MDTSEVVSQLSPQSLARAYDRFVSARWRGDDEAADTFAAWFESHWTGEAPPEPADPPEAASVLGGAGTGIRWYARQDVVLGYVSGRGSGCYLVAASEIAPPLASTRPAAPAHPVPVDRLLDETPLFLAADRAAKNASAESGGRRFASATTGGLIP